MLNIGQNQRLTCKSIDAQGMCLGNAQGDQVWLPRHEAPAGIAPGDALDVFIYIGNDNQPVATTQRALAQVGECAWLKVVSESRVGAFLDWGIPKDLLVPFAEQVRPMHVGRHQLVYVYRDNSGRLAASSRLNRFVRDQAEGLKERDAVQLIIADRTDLGVKAVVNHQFWGLLYADELLTPVRKGQRLTGYIKRLREDGRIELSLQQPGYAKVGGITEQILERLQQSGGYLPLNDKSPPELIYTMFAVSKGAFKQAVGALLKQRKIVFERDGIRRL